MIRDKVLPWIYSIFSLTFLGGIIACGSFQAVASPALDISSISSEAGREVTFMPENELHLYDGLYFTSMSEELFNSILNKISKKYTPIVSRFGANLKIIGKWRDSTVNAYAYQIGRDWYVEIFGGLARRPELSPDGLALVVCHELGHHLGGFPFYSGEPMSAEGESDYFASQACAKEIWGAEEEENDKAYKAAPSSAIEFCESKNLGGCSLPTLCVRTVSAGMGLAELLGGEELSPLNPDRRVVRKTLTSHPAAQCRLDTYAQAAICTARWNNVMIPQSEAQTAKYTCTRSKGFSKGNRPLCWYKPGR